MFRRNVLIFHTAALGDFVLTFPLALGLGRLYPQSRVIYVTHAQKGKLAEAALGVESADVEGGWHHLLGHAAKLPEPARRRLEQAHLVVGFINDPDKLWTANVRKVAPEAEVLAIDPRPPAGSARHISEHLLDRLAPVPAVQSATAQMVRWINAEGVRLPRQPRFDVLVHPGSGGREKCWPVERFAKLVKQLRGQGRRVAVVVGEVEAERLTRAEIDGIAASAELLQPRTFVELLRHLLASHAFIGNDSGPSHLAGICGLETLCLFGPTDPRIWRPLGPRVKVLHHSSLAALSVGQVITAVGLPVSERPSKMPA